MTTAKGGQKLAGSVKWLRNKKTGKPCWHARFTMNDKTRSPYKALDPSIPYEDEAGAKACAVETAKYYRENKYAPEAVTETCDEWFKRFHAAQGGPRGSRPSRRCAGGTRSGWRPRSARRTPRRWGERISSGSFTGSTRRSRRGSKARVASGCPTGISPSTATNIWGDLVHAFDEMVRSKDAGATHPHEEPGARTSGALRRGTTASKGRSSTPTSCSR